MSLRNERPAHTHAEHRGLEELQLHPQGQDSWTTASHQVSPRPSPRAPHEVKGGWSCCRLHRGRRNPPKSLCLLSTHQCCLSTAITAASGAFTPSHLGLLFLNNLICLMTREALGPPCCLDLFPWSLKGFSLWWGAATPRTGGLW